MKTFKKYVAAAKKAAKIYTKMFIGNKKHPEDNKKPIKESFTKIIKRRNRAVTDKLDHDLETKHEVHKLSNEQHEALHKFSEDPDDINGPLHAGKEADDEHLSSAVTKNKLHRKGMTVYAGLRSPEDAPTSHDGRQHVHMPAYTSTSIDPHTANDFSRRQKQDGTPTSHKYWHRDDDHDGEHAHEQHEKFDPNNPDHVRTASANHAKNGGKWITYRHMASIQLPERSRGLYLGHHSSNPSESEYVLHKGAKIAFDPKKMKIDHDNHKVIHHGKLTHDGVEKTRHHD
jgi:hypothetical protein